MDERDPGTGEDGGVSAQGWGWWMYAEDAGRGGASRRAVMRGAGRTQGKAETTEARSDSSATTKDPDK